MLAGTLAARLNSVEHSAASRHACDNVCFTRQLVNMQRLDVRDVFACHTLHMKELGESAHVCFRALWAVHQQRLHQ